MLNQVEVEQKLAALISEGKVSCFKCGERLNGADIKGFDLAAADGKAKMFYMCPNEYCQRHSTQGYRTLIALGIAEIASIAQDSPLANVRAPQIQSPESPMPNIDDQLANVGFEDDEEDEDDEDQTL